MHDSNHAASDEMAQGYFQKPDARLRPLIGFKVSHALKEKLESLQKLWLVRAEIEGAASVAARSADEQKKAAKSLDEQLKAIDFSYVCNRLLSLAADEALSEIFRLVGLDAPPANEAEWAQVRAAFLKIAKSRK